LAEASEEIEGCEGGGGEEIGSEIEEELDGELRDGEKNKRSEVHNRWTRRVSLDLKPVGLF